MDQAAGPVPAQHLDMCTQGRWIPMPGRRGLLQRRVSRPGPPGSAAREGPLPPDEVRVPAQQGPGVR
jgi:hypothetical protein